MRDDPPTLSLAFNGWERCAENLPFVKSADADDVERRFPTGEREGPLVLFWPSQGKAVMHGGRVHAGRRKVVTSCLVVADAFPTGQPSDDGGGDPEAPVDRKPYWREVFSPSATNEQQLTRGPARWNHAGVLYDESGTLVLHGGKDDHGVVCNDVVLFNFRRQSWESFSRWAGGCEAPALFGHAMAPLPVGALVVLGPLPTRRAKRGSSEDASERETMSLFLLDLAGSDKQWRAVTGPAGGPPPRRGFAMSVSAEGRSLVVGGGSYRSSKLSDIWCMDFTSNLWTQVNATEFPSAALHISTAHRAVISLWSKGASAAPIPSDSSVAVGHVTAVAEAGAASADLHVFVRPCGDKGDAVEPPSENSDSLAMAPYGASVVAVDNRGAVFRGALTLAQVKGGGRAARVPTATSQASGGFLL